MKLIFGIIALILHFTSSEDLKMIFVWQDSKWENYGQYIFNAMMCSIWKVLLLQY